MDAMVLYRISGPLVRETRPDPVPGPGEVRIRVEACAVCRTDLHVIDGELPDLHLPIVPGHEIVGRVEAVGAGVAGPVIGEEAGVPWLGHTCGACASCAAGRENLCDTPGFTGYLSPENSLVRHLIGQGLTVFMISWRNPGFDDCDLSFDDYCQLGVMDALDSIDAVLSGQRVHLAGYCLGGTLAAIAAAAMARDGDGRLSSLTLFAGQVDFTEAGRFTLFVNESQITFPESLMRSTGTLDARQMAGAFRLLRSNDLIWSRMVNSYLLGRREETTALAAWNADATRIPARMQSEYLRRLFLDSDLAEGRFRVGGQPVTLGDIRVPVFAVGTERNHIAPWRSVFELTLLTEAEVSFVLASGRHNAGIVAALEEPGRRYRVHTRTARDHYLDPAFWTGLARAADGSWRPEWTVWLAARSGEPTASPLPDPTALMLADLGPAPGTYVLEA